MALGIFGVAFFFTLSGFLITRQITSEPDIARYYRRRLIRIMPLAYVYLASNGLLAAAAGLSMRSYGWHFAFLSDWVSTFQGRTLAGGFVGHLWTIAVEVQFYLLWPLILFAAGKRRGVTLAGVVLFALAWRLTIPNPYAISLTFPSRVDAFAAGALAGMLPLGRKHLVVFSVGVCVTTISVTVMLPTDFSDPTDWSSKAAFLLSGMALMFGPAVAQISRRGPAWLSTPPLVWCGERAYSLYIWHVPLLAAAHKLPIAPALQLGVAAALIFVVANTSYDLIEIRLSAWLNRRLDRHGPLIRPKETSAA